MRETELSGTYKAVEVSTPGVLRVVERPISKPAAGQVRLRVEACGARHSDLATVQGAYPGLKLPRAPRHEVVGHGDAAGHKERTDGIRLCVPAVSLRKIWVSDKSLVLLASPTGFEPVLPP